MQGRVVEIDLKSGDILWEYDHILDVTPYMELSGQGTDKRYARFGSGAYYVETPEFLFDGVEERAAP